MILALDVGNSQIYGGLFNEEVMKISFRRNSKQGSSSDEVGIFLRSVIRENGFEPSLVKQILVCSVVPDLIYSLRGACRKYFDLEPFILQAGVKTGLNVQYRNPTEVGADRIANAVAGTALFPQRNLIIVDLGTATTFCAITKDRRYLGGSIIAGLRISMESLESRTAKLPSVEIISGSQALGKTTIESIQSGLYYSHLGAIREICSRLSLECFEKEKPFVVGTGGFAHLFEKEKIFDKVMPDLVLQGLFIAAKLNT
jgi:type III pantothenate kinase